MVVFFLSRDSNWSGSMKDGISKALKLQGHAHEAPALRLAGNQTTIDRTQCKDLTKEFMHEMQV